MAKAKEPTLTIKEINFIKGIVAGKTKQRAVLDAYNVKSPATASVMASEALKRPNVQAALAIAMERHGITLDKAIEPIGKALNATKVQITGQGNETVSEVVEDLEMQLKGSDRALKLMGVGQNKDAAPSVHFHQHIEEKKSEYDF